MWLQGFSMVSVRACYALGMTLACLEYVLNVFSVCMWHGFSMFLAYAQDAWHDLSAAVTCTLCAAGMSPHPLEHVLSVVLPCVLPDLSVLVWHVLSVWHQPELLSVCVGTVGFERFLGMSLTCS